MPSRWTDETIKLVREHFIAVTIPTWVCRSESPEGEFLRKAGIDKRWVTSSGYMSCVSASGKLLGSAPSAKVLAEFEKLPQSERKPGAVVVRDLKPEEQVLPVPPPGGLVLRVHARFLARDEKGQLRPATGPDFPLLLDNPQKMKLWQLFLQPNTEYMWLTRQEWQSLVPAQPVKGEKHEVTPAIAERMARFHLYPPRSTTSEGLGLSPRTIRDARLSTVVEDVSDSRLRLRLEGHIHIGTEYDAAGATTPNGPLRFGFETALHGLLEYDRARQAFTRFDIVAPGEVWGRWGDANGNSLPIERPGRSPFGYAFELARGESPTDRIPPGGNGSIISERTGYFGKPGK